MINSNNTSRCIVTCAFREPYVTHNRKQGEAINKDIPIVSFINHLPYSEGVVSEDIVGRFQKSLYGFKPHTVQIARNMGHKLVIWFDPSVLPTTDVNLLFDELEKNDMIIVKGDNHISKMTSDKAFNYFGLPKDIPVNHIGGTIYGFNFNSEKTVKAFELWKQAEQDGIFGNQDEFMAGHWADESCMALSMFVAGVEQVSSKTFKYLNQKEL